MSNSFVAAEGSLGKEIKQSYGWFLFHNMWSLLAMMCSLLLGGTLQAFVAGSWKFRQMTESPWLVWLRIVPALLVAVGVWILIIHLLPKRLDLVRAWRWFRARLPLETYPRADHEISVLRRWAGNWLAAEAMKCAKCWTEEGYARNRIEDILFKLKELEQDFRIGNLTDLQEYRSQYATEEAELRSRRRLFKSKVEEAAEQKQRFLAGWDAFRLFEHWLPDIKASEYLRQKQEDYEIEVRRRVEEAMADAREVNGG